MVADCGRDTISQPLSSYFSTMLSLCVFVCVPLYLTVSVCLSDDKP